MTFHLVQGPVELEFAGKLFRQMADGRVQVCTTLSAGPPAFYRWLDYPTPSAALLAALAREYARRSLRAGTVIAGREL